ncbi:MAG: molybdopterin-synthase adenylyltransferase MoeB [Gemmatimonadota bacterium]
MAPDHGIVSGGRARLQHPGPSVDSASPDAGRPRRSPACAGVIRVPRSLLRLLRMRAAAAHPEECCGVLLGHDAVACARQGEGAPGGARGVRSVVAAVAVANASACDRRAGYRIPAGSVRRLERRAERHGWAVVGFYHSHPDGPAEPSRLDRNAAWPWHTHLIVSLAAGRPGPVRAWRLARDRGRFDEERIALLGGPPRAARERSPRVRPARVGRPAIGPRADDRARARQRRRTSVSVTVRIPAALRDCADGRAAVAIRASTAGAALEAVVARHPAMRRHLFEDGGGLREFVNLYVNEIDVRDRRGLETPVTEGDVLTVVPSIAGGSGESASAGSEAPAGRGTAIAGAAAGSPVDDAARVSGVESTLEPEELARYSRHLVLPEVGLAGQERLKAAKVALVGAGGLGSPLALYLAAAGVGTLGLVDDDEVDATNLHRQVLYGARDVGRPKLEAAVERIRDVNPYVDVVTHPVRLTSGNALDVLEPYDIVVDGSDNFPTRYLVNDACVLLEKPNVYGAVHRFEGQVAVFDAGRGPCYRCLFREPPPPGLVPSCAEAGVLGVLPGIVGSLQALETIKLVLGRGDALVGRLLLFDALALRWRELKLRKDPDCPVCGEEPSQTELIDYELFCGVKTEAMEAMHPFADVPEITPTELKRRLEEGAEPTLIDVREPYEWEIVNLERHGARLIPLGELPDRSDELDPDHEIVLYCRSGSRSERAARQLRASGFGRVLNLKGGIRAWAEEIDPSMPTY